MTRRDIVRAAALLAGQPVLRKSMFAAEARSVGDSVPVRPQFPKRDFDVTKYGAVGNGKTKCTEAIRKAISDCTAAGGGRVVIPAGIFLTGAIHLDNNVNLYVSDRATLLFSQDHKDYLPIVFTRFEGTECMNYSPFIYAFEKNNIGVTGPGTLDGQADNEHWWPWKRQSDGADDRKALVKMGDGGVPVEKRVFGEGHSLRPNFVQPYRCNNVLLEGFKMRRSPMWELNPVLCRNVTVQNVDIDSHGPNNDGCDPESCSQVLIKGCTFSTGDDCIAIKSGRNQDGRRVNVPCADVVVEDCVMKDGHGGVSIGSEVSGGIKNVWVRRCEMSSPHLQRALRIKTNSYRGGDIANINFQNVNVGQVAEAAIEVDFYYEEGEGGPFRPVVKDILVSDVTCKKSKYAIYLRGFANAPIKGVTITNCTFEDAAKGDFFQNVEAVNIKNVTVNGKPMSAV